MTLTAKIGHLHLRDSNQQCGRRWCVLRTRQSERGSRKLSKSRQKISGGRVRCCACKRDLGGRAAAVHAKIWLVGPATAVGKKLEHFALELDSFGDMACKQCKYHVLTVQFACSVHMECVWCACMMHVCTLHAACVWHACMHVALFAAHLQCTYC